MPIRANSILKSIPTGIWGGDHIRLVVAERSTKIEYDCAVGMIDEPLLLNEDGNFEALGIHVFERGGPRRVGEEASKRHSALYRGWSNGHKMRLNVTLLETGEDIGTFSLGLGHPSQLEKCL
jgi:hypothetical protein